MANTNGETFGYSMNDFTRKIAPGMAQPIPIGPQAGASSLTAAVSVGDLAQAGAGVAVDTNAPLMGFVIGVAALIGLRVFWEMAVDD